MFYLSNVGCGGLDLSLLTNKVIKMKIIRIERTNVCSVCNGTGTAVSFTDCGEKEPVPCLCLCEQEYDEWLALHGIEEE